MNRPKRRLNRNVLEMVSVPGDLVSVPKAAEITGITPRAIWGMIRCGDLPAYGPRKCFRVSLVDLVDLLAPVQVPAHQAEADEQEERRG